MKQSNASETEQGSAPLGVDEQIDRLEKLARKHGKGFIEIHLNDDIMAVCSFARQARVALREAEAKLREVEAERDGLAEYVATVIANPEDVRPYVNDAIARARALREVAEAADSIGQHELADVPRNLLTPPQRHLTDALARWREGERQNDEAHLRVGERKA